MRTALRGTLGAMLATCFACAALGQTITQWNFNSVPADGMTNTGTETPSVGAGTLTLQGGTTRTFAGGSPTDPAPSDNSAINTTTYAAQGTESGLRGIRYDVATTGQSNIIVTYDQRLSNSASLWWRFEYTTDGVNFITTGLPSAGAGAGEYSFPLANVLAGSFAPSYSWNLTGFAGVNNNANFGFRIVAIFDPASGTSYTGANTQAGTPYGVTGTSRYDMVTVTAGLPQGSCCTSGSTTCNITSQASCSGLWSNGGTCSPNPCSGSCCTGPSCSAPVSPVDCDDANTQVFTLGGSCGPATCPKEVNVVPGDIAYAANVGVLADAVQQVRGAGMAPSRVGTWGNNIFIEFVQFDNRNGDAHNADGNLIAVNFGATPSAGGIIYNYSTDGSGTSQTIYTFDALNPIPVNSRVGGFAISPDNNLIGIAAFDTAQIAFLEYDDGATPGTGAGASITDGAATEPTTQFQIAAGITDGVAWLDNDTAIVLVRSTDPLGFFAPGTIAIFTMDYDATTNTISNITPRVAPTDTGVPDGSRFLGVAYNPDLSPYLYTMSSGFQTAPGSGSRIGVIDVSSWTEVATMFFLAPPPASTGSLQTGRGLAIGPDLQLYITQFAGSTATATDALIDTIDLDSSGNGVVDAADLPTLLDNSSVDFYLKGAATTASFNSLDIAIAQAAPVNGLCCYGATCRTGFTAVTCTVANLDPGNLERAGAKFLLGQTVCNLLGPPVDAGPRDYKVPCCKSDYNQNGGPATVQDLFDFLADWFAKKIGADINNPAPAPGATITVQDLFDFLTAWFAKGC